MSLARQIERMRQAPLRGVAVVRSNAERVSPKSLTERQLANRIEPLFGLIARGEVPVETTEMSRALGRAVEKAYQRQQGGA